MTFSDDILNIDTPENVVFEYDIAGIGSRFLACMVDTLLISACILLIGLGLVVLVNLVAPDGLGSDDMVVYWVIGAISLLVFAVNWGYYIFFEMYWNGQSPGKRLIHLRVIRTDGGPISLTESVVRNLVRMVDMLPTAYGIGVISMFISHQSRRLGDLAAGTLVVHDHKPATLEGLAALASAPAQPALMDTGLLPDLPVERLSAGELQAVEEFLRRRESLFNRPHLAETIARSLYARMALAGDPPEWPEAEKLLTEIFQIWRARQADHSQALRD